MAISDSYTFNLTADGIVKHALQEAGLLRLGAAVRADQASDAREKLSIILKALRNKGIILTTAERTTTPLANGTATYTLPADTVDVIDQISMLQASGSTTQTQVERMSYENYQELTDKTATGVPTRVWVEIGASVKANFWTTPNGAYVWSYRRERMIRDTDNGGVNADVTVRWLNALVLMLAVKMARTGILPLDRIVELKGEAAAAVAEAMGADNEHGDMQLVMEPMYTMRR